MELLHELKLQVAMKVAVEGCAHGELDRIYEAVRYLQEQRGVKLDLLICCGDFQATRNAADLQCMAVPPKYRRMCSFYKYYSGEKVAPVLTLFVGGNHEASNHLQELAYGGWVAPRIYYLGYAGIVRVGGLRIAGLSGIFKGHDYMKGHFERPPYSEDSKRSAYHVRHLEVFRLKQVQTPVDIFLSHDWPRGVYHHGDVNQLLRHKPFFREEVESGSLGSKPCEELLHHLKPCYWFAAHLHTKFAALVRHSPPDSPDKGGKQHHTRFLALDKCLPHRKFLQVLDIPHDPVKSLELEYDLEWLTIVYLTNHLLSVKRGIHYMPGAGADERCNFAPTRQEMDLVLRRLNNNLTVPLNFTQTVTPYDPAEDAQTLATRPTAQVNPQTMALCERLGVDDPMSLLLEDNAPDSANASLIEANASVSFLVTDDSAVELDGSLELDVSTCSPRVSLRRSAIVLPSPLHSEPDCSDVEVVNSGCDDVSTVSQGSTGGEDVSDTPDCQPTDPQPKNKKFKRRNQALYQSTDND
ncbi:lariat debranching enzyme isoform X2 [Bacillus rossius redtenbacheri]|uniref:lariat debranching enzyme isoform X2 n=1 Tax=Bacillus rossius redtenbacheri TaxID=93214 RepID=UPI002FDDE242